jgi:Flp pilus assembly pilin Flp
MFQIVTTAIANALRNRHGIVGTEYALMIVGIAALVLAGATTLGGDISGALGDIGSYLTAKAVAI